MPIRAIAQFDVTGWEQAPYGEDQGGPGLSRATVTKVFRGSLAGESTAELLMCQADPSDLSAGAGYVASERVSGTLGDRSGAFVLQHWGVSGPGGRRTSGHVVPGSGTDALEGLTGSIEISVDEKGAHTLILDYDLA